MKRCSTCGENKPESEFYSDRRRLDGLKSQCKKCHSICSILTRDKVKHADYCREWMRRSRYSTREEVRERERMRARARGQSLEVRARALANRAVKLGFLDRPRECPVCGGADLTVHAHHRDYTKPLEVTWMCSECHGKEHRKHA